MVVDSLIALLVWPLRHLPQFFFIVALISIVPACFGRELGIRRWYIARIMRLFNWAMPISEKKEEGGSVSKEEPPIISKEHSINKIGSFEDVVEPDKGFNLGDVNYLIKSGIEAVVDDEVTKRFSAEELPSWNLLTRTNYRHHFISVRLSLLWFFGLILRYFFLFPMRVTMTLCGMSWMIATMIPLSIMPDSDLKREIVYFTNLVSFRICCRAFSAVVDYHDRENMPTSSGICVANHTTTLDVCLLMQDRPYAILGQIHGGFLGWFERTLSKCTNHVWFERKEVRDRQYVVRRVREHLDNPQNYPILLFPEGTCINNTSVMMFKKGTFEIPATIFPVAIKYNPWFGDAFWNSSKHSMLQYLAVVMTSWAIVADVWYLPAMEKLPDEDALQFADRVKSVIARKGGLVDCVWDGQLKRMLVKKSYREEKQLEISKIYQKILKGMPEKDEDGLSLTFGHDDEEDCEKEKPESSRLSAPANKSDTEQNKHEITQNGVSGQRDIMPDKSSL